MALGEQLYDLPQPGLEGAPPGKVRVSVCCLSAKTRLLVTLSCKSWHQVRVCAFRKCQLLYVDQDMKLHIRNGRQN